MAEKKKAEKKEKVEEKEEKIEKKEKVDVVEAAPEEEGLTEGDRKLLYAILAISLLSLLISLYVMYTLQNPPVAALTPPANW